MKLLTASMAILSGLLISVSSMAQERIGDFTHFINTDDFTDKDTSTIITPNTGGEGVLAWGCKPDGLNVMIGVGGYMGGDSDDDIMVRYRFDQNQPSEFSYWRLFPGQNELAYMRINQVEEFTDEAMGANEVIMEAIDPLDEESRRFKMSMTGLTEAINKLSCVNN
ncbi:hypothetical protein HVA01_00840 [Halovibrio variabilis]|uniref:Uncharacterized protein n=1 Tax=Halovibrio variabilis TaxID=31910 RepID=A0A511UL98_9GAMM|nr:hypothetical protein [Halovibrio variabilis]GEN26438.1 hypothetical protein HVA01_00840 [Halovibrio variabilis]